MDQKLLEALSTARSFSLLLRTQVLLSANRILFIVEMTRSVAGKHAHQLIESAEVSAIKVCGLNVDLALVVVGTQEAQVLNVFPPEVLS